MSEISGMRTAGWILLVTAAINLLASLFTGIVTTLAGAVVDVLLGVQLLRLQHSWRAWVVVRAGIGAVLGVFICVSGLMQAGNTLTVIFGSGQIVYCASLVLLVFGTPTARRVQLGRVVFAVSVILLFAGGFLAAQAVDAEPDEAQKETT
jgi:hypothetical protein